MMKHHEHLPCIKPISRIMLKSTTRVRKLRAEFAPQVLHSLDQRSREARLLKQFRAEMTQHMGGKISAVEKALIERAAQLQLRLAIFDAKFIEDGSMSDHDTRTYLAWSNSLSRLLASLGLKPPPPRPLTPQEHLQRIHAAARAGQRNAGGDR
jgi:hypothetical protein